MSEHRVAYATAIIGGIAVGRPSGTHVVLDVHGVRELGAAEVAPRWEVLWDEVRGVRVEAERTRLRRPGLWSGAVVAVVALAGIEWQGRAAQLRVSVKTADRLLVAECTGFAGRGYADGRASALEDLLDLLVDDETLRAHLAEPVVLLTRVVEASYLKDSRARREVFLNVG